ncbi:MAG: acetate/propionate family kinase [Nanobdellota archaeon]
MTTVLVINSGSSSLKCQVINTTTKEILLKGHVDGIGLETCKVKINNTKEMKKINNHSEAITTVLEHVDTESLDAIGHRVVHGGEIYAKTVKLSEGVIDTIRELTMLAPLHNPANLQGIIACEKLLPSLEQVAVFDTSFHQTLPEHAYRYGIPKKYYEKHGVRKYGFHGTSHKFVADKASELLGKEKPNLITCHIGNGSSITAIKEGVSIDTSMGFTPLSGVVMGTRCGDLDPGIISFLQHNLEFNTEEVSHLLNKESGLLGLSGDSDMREIHRRAEESDETALLTIEKLSYDIAKYIGSYAMLLDSVDGIVFTAGLGENAYYLREKVFKHLKGLGVVLDTTANENNEETISASNSPIPVFVIPTNEELQIAVETEQTIREDD